MVRAMFRADKITATEGRDPTPTTVRVITTRYQDAVPFYLEYNFAQVGVTASNAVVKGWTDKGGKVLLKSRPVPIKQFIVSSKMSPAEAQKIKDALIGLKEAKGGQVALDTVGYKGFVAPNPEIETAVIAWLGL
jgi:ABC-type phosphate/phosphonate transport system substrate-binding protein